MHMIRFLYIIAISSVVSVNIVLWHNMQPFAMNNAAFMEGSVIMESVNSVVQTMQVTHAKTAPCSPPVF